ncbi:MULTISPECIES: hypothetical protein [unclassified Lentimonas]|uniref:hypothetical protein n=1 Tax=unclassified Lentimonas TaxID=2630993 RepID=UPI00132985FD|nr:MULTISPECIES: hypothetical protein [unclassified Lentimonas]CAA6679780.1 Unannotated [Lentimonas sp. CC4]CAA6685709.1 Unannotated [Lentimonas sp. CC6]CAA7077152.1 Unannotated [Lentimonas sp. CC4]CAA7168764.1 Unannotated [Lentimonas sp. CC21]CAA7180868.1 Unannotated [Lentimonas sp. CC8]
MRLLFLYFILTCSVFARIGETPAQIKDRYGKSFPIAGGETVISEGRILRFGKVLMYQPEGWTITATFLNDKCERIRYKKTGTWTDAQVYATLKANSNSQTWTRSQPFDKMQKHWVGVGSSTAYWHFSLGMDMKTNTYYKVIDRLKKDAVRKSKEVPNF